MDLKPIDRTDRGMSRLNAALSIYRNSILPEAQNPERQILYWIEHSKDDLADEFKCFAIQSNHRVVGYLQYSYFREEHIFFFEYLCIAGRGREGLAPSGAMASITAFLAQNYRPHFTIVFEIAQKRNAVSQWQSDDKLIRYFTRLGFRKVTFPYEYPILQSYDGNFSYPAELMVRLPEQRTVITASELRTVLRCIYFKHYLRWDRPFLEPVRFGERERLINALYSRQVTQIGSNDGFGTAGDVKRSSVNPFANFQPDIWRIADKIFGPKLPRIIAVSGVLLFTRWIIGSDWLLAPFILAVSAIYCLAEDTESSRKLFVTIVARTKFFRQRS